jgi:hypothetical protein
MTTYNVHLYREMRLVFGGIEADTPEAAASIAGNMPTGDADDIADCEGENLAALVDVAGDAEYTQSRMVDFAPARQRQAAPKLLVSLKALLPYAEGEAYCLDKLKDSLEAQAEADRAWKAIESAQAAVAEAESAGMTPAPSEIEVHALLADRKQIAAIWSIADVQTVRPDLTADQAWEVLRTTEKYHDCEYGITWDTLRIHADDLFGAVPDADDPEEA